MRPWDSQGFEALRQSAESRRISALAWQVEADFPVIFTEPGSVEETIENLKAGVTDLSEVGRKRVLREGWMKKDPRLPDTGN